MHRALSKIWLFLLIAAVSVSCTKQRVRSVADNFLKGDSLPSGLAIDYPAESSLFPRDFQSPTFRWSANQEGSQDYYACIADPAGHIISDAFITDLHWKPDSMQWEMLKKSYTGEALRFAVMGIKKDKPISGSILTFQISPDSVGADIFFRAVTLPFSYAVSNVQTIEWYIGSVSGEPPRKMLDNMPVCANCHSFSAKGPTLAMDVDYGNDKGSYAILQASDTASITPDEIISWDDFKKEENEPTFGLLSQISPSGNHVLSTVKDLSVFAAVDDNLAYSQLFFPIKGIIGIYDVETGDFSELQGANYPEYVQSNPVWSPDNETVLFARTGAHINETVKKHGSALLNIDDIKEFKHGEKEFKFNLYAVDFNDGAGGEPHPLPEASHNGKSNYFPKYSPDGKWIVFCQSENFMLLQPDSKLYIMKPDGTDARLMNCNTDNMNSWHSWSPNSRWLVFSSKHESIYTRLYLTHIDENGNDSPPVLLENLVFDQRAANIPEFFPGDAGNFKKIQDGFSTTAPHYARLATDNIRSKYYLMAQKHLDKALELDPDYIDTYMLKILLNSLLLQVNSAKEKNEKNRALAIVDSLIAGGGDQHELQYLRASLLNSLGEGDQAEDLLLDIVADDPGFYRAWELLASIYRKKDQPVEMIRMYKKMIGLVPANEAEIKMLIAKYYISAGRTDEALSLLKDLSTRYPGYEGIHESLCSIYIREKNVTEANRELARLMRADSTNYTYYLMAADIAAIAGDHPKASRYSNQAMAYLNDELEKNPENVPLKFEKANLLQKRNETEASLAIYDGVLKDFPDNYQAMKEKARIMLMQERWKNAIMLYERLTENYTPEVEFYNNMAIAWINLGGYEAALKNFRSTLELDALNVDALFNRSRLYNILGDKQKAADDLNRIRKILQAKENLTVEEEKLLKQLG